MCVCVCVCVCVFVCDINRRSICIFIRFITLTLWRRNYYFFNFSTPCILNVINTGTKQVSIMKQIAF